MRRSLFLIVLGILVMDATGLEALVSQEPCTSVQQTQSDGGCPPLCVRCTCCAQPIVPEIPVLLASSLVRQPFIDLYSHGILPTVPSKIFHVPKLASPTV